MTKPSDPLFDQYVRELTQSDYFKQIVNWSTTGMIPTAPARDIELAIQMLNNPPQEISKRPQPAEGMKNILLDETNILPGSVSALTKHFGLHRQAAPTSPASPQKDISATKSIERPSKSNKR